MGAKLSKHSTQTNTTTTTTNSLFFGPRSGSYLQECELDQDVQVFDSHLHHQTSHIINSLSLDGNEGFEVRSISLDSLRQVTSCLIEMNQEVVRVILECKKDIWNNQELFGLVQDYFENSVQTLDFFTALDNCLKRARDKQLIIRVALLQFEEEMEKSNGDFNYEGNYGKILQELRKFQEGGDPFTEEFLEILQSVYKQQLQMLDKLQVRKHKLDKKLKNRGELVTSMQVGTSVAIIDLDRIRVLVHKFENQIESLLGNVQFALMEEGAVIKSMGEIKMKTALIMQTIDELGKHGNKYSGDIRRARTVILQRIIKHPNED